MAISWAGGRTRTPPVNGVRRWGTASEPNDLTNQRRKKMSEREMAWQNHLNKRMRDDEMRWYHWIIGLAIFGMVPFADSIIEGIMWMTGVK